MKQEFSRVIRVDQLTGLDREYVFHSDATERKDLARRFSLLKISHLQANVSARWISELDIMRARVNLVADVVQAGVVTLEPVEVRVDKYFEVDYVTVKRWEELNLNTEVVLDPGGGDPPEIMVEGKADIGSIISEYLALSLDDYPRKPGAIVKVENVQLDKDEQINRPFEVLKSYF